MRTQRLFVRSLAVVVLSVCSIGAAQAAMIPFFGSRDSFNGTPPVPNPPVCGTAAGFLDIPEGPGSSNLGPFTHNDSHCIAGGDVFDGVFDWDFGSGDTMVGTFSGLVQVGDVTTFMETFVLTGGTGRFMNASGSFVGIGVVMFGPSGANTHMDFEGVVTLVPEPATLALLVVCLGGLAASRRKAGSFAA